MSIKKRRAARPKKAAAKEVLPSDEQGASFPIVGIGASAGGLEAFTQLLEALPADTGMAFILIQHLDPLHTSLLSQALGKATAMPVLQAGDGMVVAPDHVYVIPPNADISLHGDMLSVVARGKSKGAPHLPIDSFFRSLAIARGRQAIGVVLSGTASDGTEGLRAIKDEHGITLAQDPLTAKFSEMPQSALNAGVVDQRLALPLLAEELSRLGRHPYLAQALAAELPQGDAFEQILRLVRGAGGIDFTEYKPATLQRRLGRRLALRRFSTLESYLEHLRADPKEVLALQEDILIHVTSLFRDPEVFEELKATIFARLLDPGAGDSPVRIWVAGCSTGEEVYSLAIALLERLEYSPCNRPIQIFGTDVSEQAIAVARLGVYPDAAVRHLSEEQRRTFFVRVDAGYRIQKIVREMCVFVRHDLARDPPFAKLDLISCRNVLIYFAAPLQKRIIATFHYCLNQPGHLLLGRTESLVAHGRFFTPLSKANKIFTRTGVASTLRFTQQKRREQTAATTPTDRAATDQHSSPAEVSRLVDRILLGKYAPPGALVNQSLEVLQFRGRTGDFLEPAAGDPQSNLLKMARPGLLSPLRAAFAEARRERRPAQREGSIPDEYGATRKCRVLVLPLIGEGNREPLFLVLFEDAPSGKPVERERRGARPPNGKLEDELASTREYLQSLIEEHGRTNDDLGSANEELISSNEELQSMNEELETAKEELQSANEELVTVNDELHSTNQQLHKVNGDLINLLDTVDLPVVILDLQRRIRRFTPMARDLMNVLPGDIGRPIDDIRLNVQVTDLDQRIARAISSGLIDESEVKDRHGHWHRMQVRPYRSPDGIIDGALVSLVDIDALKHTVHDAEWARDYAAGVVDAVQVPLLVLDEGLRAHSGNEAFYAEFGLTPETTEGKAMTDWGPGWDIQPLQRLLADLFAGGGVFQGVEVEREFGQRRRWLSFSARLVDPRIGARTALLAIEDVTERKRGEAERAELLLRADAARAEAEGANGAKDNFLATLSHELRTPLSTILMQAQLMRRGDLSGERVRHISEVLERCTLIQSQLIDDLLDTSRIVTGKLRLELATVDVAELVRTAYEAISEQAARKPVEIEVKAELFAGRMLGDRVRLQQVIWNLLGNAIKFTPAGGRILMKLTHQFGHAQIEVTDTGTGIDPAFLPHIFTRFSQQNGSSSRRHGGLGLGLAIVRHIVELHGGTVRAKSGGAGQGTTLLVSLPLSPELEAVPVPDAPTPAPAIDLGGMLVLLADDDVRSREATEELLHRSGAKVRAVASAEEARTALERFVPALIVSDIAMPGEDGYSFLRSVRQGGKPHARVPAIALTALAGIEDRQAAISAGFQEHVAKPVDAERLLRLVARLTPTS